MNKIELFFKNVQNNVGLLQKEYVFYWMFFMLFYVFNFKTMFLIDIIFEAIKFKYQLAVYLQTSTTS